MSIPVPHERLSEFMTTVGNMSSFERRFLSKISEFDKIRLGVAVLMFEDKEMMTDTCAGSFITMLLNMADREHTWRVYRPNRFFNDWFVKVVQKIDEGEDEGQDGAHDEDSSSPRTSG